MPFRPLRAENAIFSATFACEVAPQLDASVLQAVLDLHPKFQDRLPQKAQLPGFTIRLGPGAGSPQPVQTIGGAAFSSYHRDGSVEQQFNVQPALISYTEFQYSNWDAEWQRAKEMLEMVFDLAPHASVQAFGLQYQDRFIAEQGSPEPIDFTTVVRSGGKYLPAVVFEAKDVWHSHFGSVAQSNKPCVHSLNDVVNIGLVRRPDLEAPQLALEITFQHRRVFDPPSPLNEARQWADQLFADMHDCDKAIMRDILTPAMSERIGLIKKA